MKSDVHPEYYPNAKVTCACGADFEVGSTIQEIKVEICSDCHPFYTGQEKIVDTAGRVEKFKARMEAASKTSKSTKGSKKKTKAPKDTEEKKETEKVTSSKEDGK